MTATLSLAGRNVPAKRQSDPATAYAHGVLAGTYPAGKMVHQACRRHLADLRRQDTPDFPFVWQPERGEIFSDFCLFLRHYKGHFQNQPFRLESFQSFITFSIFGWVHRETSLRRFRTVVIRLPRKNGKTGLAAALALYLLSMDGEAGAEVYFAATKREQAKLGWSDATTFLRYSPPSVRKRFIETQNKLSFPSTNSKMVPLSGDSKTQDGLNPHAAICDETHQWPNGELWDALIQGFGARMQPLIVDISTAGADTNSFAYSTHKRAEDVLQGTLADDMFFAYIASADKEDEADYKNPMVWEKANPGLGSIKSYASIQQEVKDVEATPSKLTAFLIKQLNLWVNASERWLDPADWKAGNLKDLAKLLHGRRCHGALDLAKVNDLSSFALVFPPEEVEKAIGVRKYAFLAWHWCPADDIPSRTRSHRVPYELWTRAKWITATPGNTTDFVALRSGIERACQDYEVVDVAFDRWGSLETVQQLEASGMHIVEFGQGYRTMGAPTSEFERLVKGGELLHEDNPLLAWEAGNVTCEMDPTGAIKPSKKRSREKIDGIVAGIMGLGRCMALEEKACAPGVWVA